MHDNMHVWHALCWPFCFQVQEVLEAAVKELESALAELQHAVRLHHGS